MASTPCSLGYRMPAEWERHESTWLSWPKDPTTFPPEIIEDVEWTYVKMIDELTRGEKVDLLIENAEIERRVSGMLKTVANVRFHQTHSVDVWIRDYGPIFVKNDSITAIKWTFNAWGDKYEDLLPDNRTGFEVATLSKASMFEPGIVLEGGSIDVNGAGTCLTTKQCLLNKNRNPTLGQQKIERYLADYLGITSAIWIDSGIAGDDTDGHVDDIARFVSENDVVCMVEEDPNDENYAALNSDLEILQAAKIGGGKQINVTPVPMPKPVSTLEGRLPASYANFYIANSAVLVPIFEDEHDRFALKTLERFFPNRRVVGINCRSLVYGFGGIHCVTQQQPSL
jgi:agmatine deiminase